MDQFDLEQVSNSLDRIKKHTLLIKTKLFNTLAQYPDGRQRFFQSFTKGDLECCISDSSMDRYNQNVNIDNVLKVIRQYNSDEDIKTNILRNIRSNYEYDCHVGVTFPDPLPDFAYHIAYDLGPIKIYIWSKPNCPSASQEQPSSLGFELDPKVRNEFWISRVFLAHGKVVTY